MDDNKGKSLRRKLFGWWYVSIGAGFVLLGIQRILIGEKTTLVILRFVIAAGFFALGYAELKYGLSRK